jgi:hypothetical protein
VIFLAQILKNSGIALGCILTRLYAAALAATIFAKVYSGDILRIENPSVWQIPMFSQIFSEEKYG